MLGKKDEYEPLSRGAYYKAMLKEGVKNISVEVITQKNSDNA